MTTVSSPPLLSFKEVQCLCGVKARATIYAMVRRGELPAPKRVGGRHTMWMGEDIQAWLRNLPPVELKGSK
jgi:predicted DNA-binding transcriptional regulator AlpA